MQPSGNDWPSQGVPVTSQDLQALDASWLNVSQGPVDMGLSPSLSHESQSTRPLTLLSEPDLPLLPPGLDLSFISEPSWDPSAPVMYSSPQAPQGCAPNAMASPQNMPGGLAMGPANQGFHGPQPEMYGPQQPVYYFQGAQAPGPRRTVSDPSLIQRRPIMPRTEEFAIQGPPAHGQYHMHQHQTSGAGYAEPATVSTAQGSREDTMAQSSVPMQGSGYAPQQPRANAPVRQVPTPRSDTAPPSRSSTAAYGPEHGHEDFTRYIRYDQDEKPVHSAESFNPGYGHMALQPYPVVPGEIKAGLATPPQDGSAQYQTASAPASMSGEDEGRHRNHPLYSEGPHADGLYHCPFKSDPSCQHKPTKLKCNYDKFIDSHLKPFRCKVDACSKQEFSSTACLLRHEREAHGMHGHGDRPHLCFYPGCERGIPGNGFPRRYNLFDHMKRVHDHKEDPASSLAAAEAQGPRKTAGRKRKSPSSVSEEPAAQRQKTQHVQPPSPPTLAMPPAGYEQPMPGYAPEVSRRNQNRQRILYSQWANQRELLEFQMSSVRSPDDEAGLASISQNIEELRRLSHQARHG
ncbi:hypothetical protein M409DRAFT_18302 [Zasmidium cellare ATCC 36951]|uniref:C2H2-type domain-containing protein n=1 Tax=Zasmidium cellare ATCC 36951 TaxID=1080233 RepID=A0A6A6CVW7_ZASCE|nr:uncharacterized protein M409DRAFT_18302 [Zasmidium cellare ATCC 36951]KAF2171185.1 hypothetical protein M409DRAFT_18302 [Zasmidium cellare ATCC 36951]